MPLFGTHELTIDSKNRLSIPVAVFREIRRDREAAKFYLLPGRRLKTLALLPEDVYVKECDVVHEDDVLSDDAYEYLQFVRANTVELVTDAQGRVLIPERLLRLAGLGSEVALTGMRDRLELWNRAEHEEFTKQSWTDYPAKRAAAQEELRRLRQERRSNGTPEAGC